MFIENQITLKIDHHQMKENGFEYVSRHTEDHKIKKIIIER